MKILNVAKGVDPVDDQDLATKKYVDDKNIKYEVFTSVTNGLVPASGASSDKYLKGDGTWDLPESEGVFHIMGESFISTEGQTVFTLTKGEYNPNSNRIQLYVWGIRQPNNSFIETNSTTISLKKALPVGTKIYFEWVY